MSALTAVTGGLMNSTLDAQGGQVKPSAKATPAKRSVVELNFSPRGVVLIRPRDKDLFAMSVEKAIDACEGAAKVESEADRFESEFLSPLNQWCVDHADKIRACYIPVAREAIQVFVVTKSRKFDFEFAEHVAAIEMKLARAGWYVGVSQLPEADDVSLETFFNPEGALQVYADSVSAPE